MESIKCKSCRETLCSNPCLAPDHRNCSSSLQYFLSSEEAPPWVKSELENGSFTKGKIRCPKCKAKLGSFDFTLNPTCNCGIDHATIWLTKSKIDIINIREENALRNKIQKLRNMTTNVMCSSSSNACSVQSNDNEKSTSEETNGPQNVSEVAKRLTQRGRECVATFYAGISNEVETVFSGNLETPASTDEETDHSIDTGAHIKPSKPASALSSEIYNRVQESREELTPFTELPDIIKDIQGEFRESGTDGHESGEESASENVDAFTCSVCLEIYYNPQQCEPCKHVFCDPCLRQVNSSSQHTGTADVRCPLCRKVIKKCASLTDFWKETKAQFPLEYQERHRVERKKRRNRPSLPGTNSRSAQNRRAANQRGGTNVLTVWAGVCFVMLFMMLGFTVFATTVGFVAWYFLELAMDMTVDLTLELQTFTGLFKSSTILFCIDGGLTQEKWNQLYESAGRVLGAFTNLVRSKNISDVANLPGWIGADYREEAAKAYKMLWNVTQTKIANHVVFGCLVTFILYRFAKYMQARRV